MFIHSDLVDCFLLVVNDQISKNCIRMFTVPATIEALPEIVEAVGNQLTVMIDGGIRNGMCKILSFNKKTEYSTY